MDSCTDITKIIIDKHTWKQSVRHVDYIAGIGHRKDGAQRPSRLHPIYWVYDSQHLQADCQKPGSAPEPYAR